MADIKAVIFDIDGTLVEFKYDSEAVMKKVVTFVICSGIPEDLIKLDQPLGDSIERVRAYLVKENRIEELMMLRDGVEKIMFKYEMRAVKATKLLDGADDVLRKLKGLGLRLTALTNAGATSVNYLMNRFHLDNHFEIVITRDECEAMKPAPDGVLKTIDGLGLERDQVILIGDSGLDIVAAMKAGITSVGVASGARTAPELKELGAKYVLNSVLELPNLVESLQKGREPPSMNLEPERTSQKSGPNGAKDL